MGFKGFFKKEIKEILKTSKKFVLPSIFLFFGFLSPLTARYMKELVASLSPGLESAIPDPKYVDSFVQFFKNIGQIGVIVIILVFMGTVVEEKVKGSVVLVLTKSVSRTQFIICKFLSSLLFFTATYLLSAAAFIYYTYILFPDFTSSNVGITLLMPWIYGVFMIALTIFSSTISKSHTMAAVYGFITFAVISSVSLIPKVGKYLPGALNNIGMEILTGAKGAGEVIVPSLIALGLAGLLILGSIAIFNRQEL